MIIDRVRRIAVALGIANAVSLGAMFPSAAQQASSSPAQPASPSASPPPIEIPARCERPYVLGTLSYFAVASDGTIYLSENNGLIIRFAPDARGDAKPATMCLPPFNDPPYAPASMTVAGDRLYLVGIGALQSVDRGATGPASPRTIGMPAEDDRTGLYVKDESSRNNTSNSGVIGSRAYPMGPTKIAVDGAGTAYVLVQSVRIYGGCSSRVFVFGPDANGDVSPSRSFAVQDPGTHPDWQDRPGCPPVVDFAMDSASRLYYIDLDGNLFISRPNAAQPNVRVARFAVVTEAHGKRFAAPYTPLALNRERTLFAGVNATVHVLKGVAAGVPVDRPLGGPRTRLTEVDDIAIDGAGKLYVLDCAANRASILVFGPNASGNVAPLYAIAGPHTMMSCRQYDTSSF